MPVRQPSIREMNVLIVAVACFAVLLALGFIVAFTLVASPSPGIDKPRDIFGFSLLEPSKKDGEIPDLKRYAARDGEELAYRLYESSSARILVFLHGSSFHGGGYDGLAAAISASGAAKVVLPNLRGHYQSGRRRGDVDYIGQYEDDIVDLLAFLRREGLTGPITLGGHSSGGGLAIRFAGGGHGNIVSRFLLLAPIIPVSPAVRDGSAGGWSSLNMRRIAGLLMLNVVGIHGYDGLWAIEFNKPAKFWDGAETLAYSYRLNASYHPRYRYAQDVRALDGKALVLVGADDEAVDAEALRVLFAANAPRSRVAILPKINHFGIFFDALALRAVIDWLRGSPAP
jgi:pimeloyl-ACP methyl ester carboxylesterase